MNLNGKSVEMAEINFLCVHKQLRAHRLAPVLIREITRRVNLTDRWSAVYTAGITFPTPVCNATYWHRALNPKKLIDIGFSSLPPGTPLSRYMKRLKLPASPQIQGTRSMQKKDVPAVHKLLREYLLPVRLSIVFTEHDVEHFFLPREDVVYSFVVQDG